MCDDVVVRKAIAGDVGFLRPQVYIAEETLRRKIDLDEFIIAERNDKPVGFIELEYLWSMVPYIALIRVLEEHRRQGIGKRMLGFLERFLANRNHKRLYSSSQENEPEPQDWHRHMGFEECGKIEGINDGIGEIFFCKEILDE